MPAPRIVAKNYSDARRFATEDLGLPPNTYRTITTVGGLAGYGYTLHLAPGWSKAPHSHAIRNKIKFKRGIEVIDHDAAPKKESTRKVETAPEPPEGWFNFGTHVDHDGPVEFSDETDESGMPKWERPVEKSVEEEMLGGDPEHKYLNAIEETDAETGAPEPGEDAEDSEKSVQRRRRRCKTCGELVEPDDVEAHAAAHEEE